MVSWAAPSGGGPLVSYTLTSVGTSTGTVTSCAAIQALFCTVTGITTGGSYSFVATANNAVGSALSDPSIPVVTTAPGAPGTPTVLVTASGVATVTWTEPTTGGVVTDYTVVAMPGPVSAAGCTNVVGLTCSFDGLTPATAYTFRVTANSPAGNTQSAASSPAVKPGPPSTPGVPTLALAGPNAVRVTWTAANAGGPVTGYSVASVPAVTAPVSCTSITALTCVFNRLVSGTPYSFTVTATGPVGPASVIGSVGTIVPGPPDAPGKPVATLTGISGQVLVSWTAPSPGAGIAGYTVQNPAGAVACTATTATYCLVTGLSGTGFTFRVQANGITDSGDSAFSPFSDPITPGAVGAPAMPNKPVAQAIGVAQLSVSWTMPAGGGPVTSYTVAPVSAPAGTPAGLHDHDHHPVCVHGSRHHRRLPVPGDGARRSGRPGVGHVRRGRPGDAAATGHADRDPDRSRHGHRDLGRPDRRRPGHPVQVDVDPGGDRSGFLRHGSGHPVL